MREILISVCLGAAGGAMLHTSIVAGVGIILAGVFSAWPSDTNK